MALRYQKLALDTGLFLVLVILADGLLGPWQPLAQRLTTTFYLALFLNLGMTVLDGGISPRRRMLWLQLMTTWAASILFAFIIPRLSVLPQLQRDEFSFWLLTDTPWFATLLNHWPQPSVAMHAVLLGFLCLDVVALHGARWLARPLWVFALFLLAAAATAVMLRHGFRPVVAASLFESWTYGTHRLASVPPWYFWPCLALLRAVPDKLISVAVLLAALSAPLAWPWMRAGAFRFGRMRWVWPWLCALLLGAWIGLGYLGGLPPSEGVALWAARSLVAYHLAFFLLLPLILRWTAEQQALERLKRGEGE